MKGGGKKDGREEGRRNKPLLQCLILASAAAHSHIVWSHVHVTRDLQSVMRMLLRDDRLHTQTDNIHRPTTRFGKRKKKNE